MIGQVKRFPLAQVRKHAKLRPEGYYEELVAAGRIDGDSLLIEQEALYELHVKYTPFKLALVKHGLAAARRWFAAGCPLIGKEDFEHRVDQCAACDEWVEGDVREGKGHCRLCGCGKAKLHLATEECPDLPARWASLG